LAHHQKCSIHLVDGEIRPAAGVLEVAEAEQSVRQAIDQLGRIANADPHQHGRAAADRAKDESLGPHLGAADTLDDEAHRPTGPSTEERW
jgi:hypothetical protein